MLLLYCVGLLVESFLITFSTCCEANPMSTPRPVIPAVLALLLWAFVVSACGTSAPTAPTSPPATTAATRGATATPLPVTPTAPATTAPSAIPTAKPTLAPTATLGVASTPVLPPGQTIRWSQSARGLTVGLFLNPYPMSMGGSATFGVVLTDATGQPISDATVTLSLSAGMAGMEGEHDESQDIALTNKGSGTYQAVATPGRSDMVFTGMTVNIKRGDQVWTFAISKDDLTPR